MPKMTSKPKSFIDGVFDQLPDAPAEAAPTPDERLYQTTFWASRGEMETLDRRLQELRWAGWRKASKAVLLRSALKVLLDLDLTGVRGEEDLERLLRERLAAR